MGERVGSAVGCRPRLGDELCPNKITDGYSCWHSNGCHVQCRAVPNGRAGPRPACSALPLAGVIGRGERELISRWSTKDSILVRLRQPTDFLILEALHSYGRNVAPNVAEITGKSRKNVNNRLPVLADYGLVRKIGPADRSGLYEITDRGRVVLQLRDQYDEADDFDALVDRRLDAQNGSGAAEATVRGSGPDESDEQA